MLKKQNVTLNSIRVTDSDAKVNLECDTVKIDGKPVSYKKNIYIMVNKPKGVISASDDKKAKTVVDLVPEPLRRNGLFPAGRLDKDTEGALLITDDGELAHRMLSPKHHIPKIYIVKLDRPFENKYINQFADGMVLANGDVCAPAKVRMAENCEKLAFVELTEGKYHQVKRMFAAVGNHVQFLKRVSLGSLILPEKLGTGQAMELLHKDVENLFEPLDFDLFFEKFAPIFSANLINN